MKYKNYNSAIHNFTHSFISIDFSKSGKLAFNYLIDLNNNGLISKANFDFISKTVTPNLTTNKNVNQLIKDYSDWLPIHFKNHNCNIEKLNKLEIKFSIDLENLNKIPSMQDTVEIELKALVTWQAFDKEEKTIELNNKEVIKGSFLKTGIPELN